MFAPELKGLDREQQVRDWYNGYSWRGAEKAYNPYDVLLLRRGQFAAHWFETGPWRSWWTRCSNGGSRRCHWTRP